MVKFYKATRGVQDITAGKVYRVELDRYGDEAFFDDVGDERSFSAHSGTDGCQLVLAEEPTNPFLKAVTETRILNGTHFFKPNNAELKVVEGHNSIHIETASFYTKQSLAELARILAEISEAMA